MTLTSHMGSQGAGAILWVAGIGSSYIKIYCGRICGVETDGVCRARGATMSFPDVYATPEFHLSDDTSPRLVLQPRSEGPKIYVSNSPLPSWIRTARAWVQNKRDMKAKKCATTNTFNSS